MEKNFGKSWGKKKDETSNFRFGLLVICDKGLRLTTPIKEKSGKKRKKNMTTKIIFFSQSSFERFLLFVIQYNHSLKIF